MDKKNRAMFKSKKKRHRRPIRGKMKALALNLRRRQKNLMKKRQRVRAAM